MKVVKILMLKEINKKLCFIITFIFLLNYNFVLPICAKDNLFPELSCKSCCLFELDTGKIIFEKNKDLRVEPASLVKIMTAMIVLENVKNIDEEKVVVKKSLIDEMNKRNAQSADFIEGEILTVRQLLQWLLIYSACDAAQILADYICPGNVTKFVDLMNNKARELKMNNTFFVNPHGLHEYEDSGLSLDEHNAYSSAYDMSILTKYAMQYPVFKDIVLKTTCKVPPTNKHKARNIETTIQPLIKGSKYYNDQISPLMRGIKTGVEIGGRSYISSIIKDKKTYICCALCAPFYVDETKPYYKGYRETVKQNGSFIDTINIYKWLFGYQ